ncbi:hypothetical protein JCM14036_28360 [Desulfotomaculum defluvii]
MNKSVENQAAVKLYLDQVLQEIRAFEDSMPAGSNQVELNTLLSIMQSLTRFTVTLRELKKEGLFSQLTRQELFNPVADIMESLNQGDFNQASQIVLTRVKPLLIAWQPMFIQNKIVGVIFSKDRAMQLDATLRSFYLHCQDLQRVELNVIYLTSNDQYQEQYQTLIQEYPEVVFIQETHFKEQLLKLVKPQDYILFLVDDNLFVRNFSLQQFIDCLEDYPDALGYSLRLGWNSVYCYTYNCPQRVPNFQEIQDKVLLYDWIAADHDFAYSLEISSSLYRTSDLFPLLQMLPFNNPNTLEALLVTQRQKFRNKNKLLCSQYSLTFCNPINKVQQVFENRVGNLFSYSVEELSKLFDDGYRVDVEKYKGYLPMACHEEVKLFFTRNEGAETTEQTSATVSSVKIGVVKVEETTAKQAAQAISFFIPAFNCERTLEEAVQSILNDNISYGDEIIIVNDGSSDGTEELIDRLAARYSYIRKINHPRNKGGAAARNTAVEHARNNLLFCLDADNILVPDTIPKLKNFMLENHADVAVLGEVHYFQTAPDQVTHKWIFTPKTTLADCLSSNIVPGSSGNYLFTRESWLKAGGYPEYADANDTWGFAFRQLAAGANMLSMSDSHYYHRYGHNSYWIRESRKGKMALVVLQILLPYLDLIEDEDVDYIMGREGRLVWYYHLSTRPLRLKSGVVGSGGKVIY